MKESQQVEWKSSWRDDYLRWICGFANAEGGRLVIGRDDRGAAVGVKDARKLMEEIPNKVRDILGIMVDVNLRRVEGKDLVEIRVEPYPYPVSYKGEYHYRSGSTKQELKGAALDRFLLGKQGQHWDGVPVPRFGMDDLAPQALAHFRKLAERSGRVADGLLAESDAALIDKLRLDGGELLRRAAVLLFGKDPERLVTGAFLKIGFFRTDSDLLYHDEIHGDLFTQIDRGLDLLLTKYLKAGLSYQGPQRIETLPVPARAVREALINAIAHKDYAAAIPVQVSVYSDKLLIWNPGHLPEGWTLANLTRKHASYPFNPDIANTLFRAAYLESWGRGIDMIRQACQEHGCPEPLLRWDNGLWVEFRFAGTDTASPQVTGQVAPQVAGQVTEHGTAQVIGEVTAEVTAEVPPQVTPKGERLLAVLKGAMDRDDLQKALGLKDRKSFHERYLQPALEAGLIRRTIPDKPTSRLQRYRLTAAGEAYLAARQQESDPP
ncbi:MAG: ATP-dependent helicase RecG [Acidobacteriota bacterium]|jgi:ATP-dependent DNA helicase RecG|nr:ATP-dependent helicase RecG [Acidobacteriota bacterium]